MYQGLCSMDDQHKKIKILWTLNSSSCRLALSIRRFLPCQYQVTHPNGCKAIITKKTSLRCVKWKREQVLERLENRLKSRIDTLIFDHSYLHITSIHSISVQITDDPSKVSPSPFWRHKGSVYERFCTNKCLADIVVTSTPPSLFSKHENLLQDYSMTGGIRSMQLQAH